MTTGGDYPALVIARDVDFRLIRGPLHQRSIQRGTARPVHSAHSLTAVCPGREYRITDTRVIAVPRCSHGTRICGPLPPYKPGRAVIACRGRGDRGVNGSSAGPGRRVVEPVTWCEDGRRRLALSFGAVELDAWLRPRVLRGGYVFKDEGDVRCWVLLEILPVCRVPLVYHDADLTTTSLGIHA